MPQATTFVALFCGCGGFTLGMLRAGLRCLAAVDSSREAIATLEANLVHRRHADFEPPMHALEKDLTRFSPQDLSALLGTQRVDVIVGGPPCQGFSTVRQRDGSNHGTIRLKEDTRRHLYRCFLDYVEFFQPSVFVIENVLGLRTAVGGSYFTAIQHEARILGRSSGRVGYRVHAQIEEAPRLGVPQKRRRQLIFGVRNDLPGYFPSELAPARRAVLGVTLGDAIGDLPVLVAGAGQHLRDYDLGRRHDFLQGRRGHVRRHYLFEVLEAGSTRQLANHVARPHSARDLRDFALLPEGTSSAEMMRAGVEFEFPYDKTSFKDRYTRQHRNRPCSTIVAHLSKDGLMFIHPTQNRSLTPREAARVQSFPDWFEFPRARTHAFRLVGNAVPPLVAESVGLAVRAFLASCHRPERSRTEREHCSVGPLPTSIVEANGWLAIVAAKRVHQLRRTPREEFLRAWHALLWLLPELHPDSALDHGEEVVETCAFTDPLPLLDRRFLRSGWPVALELVGREAWRRFEIGELSDETFYCVAAQVAGLNHRAAAKFGGHCGGSEIK